LSKNSTTPALIFTRLLGLANFIDWGRHVYRPPNKQSPPMGFDEKTIFKEMNP
jgi:hypothetical protein